MSRFRREQTLSEEKINSITHAVGIVFALIAIPFMIVYAAEKSNASTIWGVSVFGFAMLMVYAASTVYHATRQNTRAKRTLRVWDHISIFVMIGGSYTPLVIKYTDSLTCLVFLSVMWSIVALGSFLKIFYTGKYLLIEVILYIAQGWMIVFIIKPIIANMPSEILTYIIVSGLFYMAGVVFYLWKKLNYHHAVWHVFVLAGTVTHFFAVYNSIPINIKFS